MELASRLPVIAFLISNDWLENCLKRNPQILSLTTPRAAIFKYSYTLAHLSAVNASSSRRLYYLRFVAYRRFARSRFPSANEDSRPTVDTALITAIAPVGSSRGRNYTEGGGGVFETRCLSVKKSAFLSCPSRMIYWKKGPSMKVYLLCNFLVWTLGSGLRTYRCGWGTRRPAGLRDLVVVAVFSVGSAAPLEW